MRALTYIAGKLSNVAIPDAAVEQIDMGHGTVLNRHQYYLKNDLVEIFFTIYSVEKIPPLRAVELARESLVEGINAL